MAINFGAGFNIAKAEAVDTRIYLKTLADMLTIDENVYPEVYFAICEENGKLYLFNKSNISNPTTGKFRVLEGSGSAKIGNWTAGESYNTDDLVVYNNAIYQCIATNNDAVFDNDKWKVLGSDFKIEEWATGKDYKEKDLVIYSGKLYQCITSPQADDTTFDDTEWLNLSGEDLFEVIEKTTIDIDTDLQEGNFIVKGEVEGVTLDELVNIHKDTNICIITTLGGRVIKFDKTTGTYAKTEDNFITAKEVHNELYHLETIPEHYELCNNSDGALKVMEDLNFTDPLTEIKLSDVKAEVLSEDYHNYVEGDYVRLVAEQKDVETTTYIPRNEGYTRKQINDKIANLTVKGASDSKDVLYDVKVEPSIDNVRSALDKLFAKVYYIKPQITSFTANPTGGLFEKGETITAPTFTWAYNKDIKTQTLTDIVLTDNTDRTATFGNDITTNKTFTLSASDGENTVTKSISYKFVDPTYVGVVDNGNVDETNIVANCEKLIRENTTLTKKVSPVFQTVVFATTGTLTSIINQNNYEVLSSFTKTVVSIGGENYNVYALENINVNNFAYTFKF